MSDYSTGLMLMPGQSYGAQASAGVTVTVAGAVVGNLSRDDLLAAVVRELRGVPLGIVNATITAPDSGLNTVTLGFYSYSYLAVLTVARPDATWTNDLIAQAVNGAFEDHAGNTPTSIEVTSTDTLPTIAAPTSSLPDVGGFVSRVTSGALGVLLLIVLAIGALIYAIGWSPNTPAVAGALRL